MPLRPPRSRLVRWESGPAGSQGAETTTSLPRYVPGAHRAPLTAGALVLLLAALVAASGSLWVEPSSVPAASSSEPTLATTVNVRALPDATAPVVAVLAAGRAPRVTGRLADGSWLLVAFGPTEGERGWLPADRMALEPRSLEALMTLEPPAPPQATEVAAPSGLPDLVVGAVFLMRDGHIALDIRNDGDGALTDARIPVLITRASGETVGVLEVGPTTLAPQGTATVVTPVVVTSTGTYTLQLDRQESIIESARTNNSATKLLVAGGG